MWCRRETWAANTRSTFVVPNQLLSQKSLSVSFTIDVEKLLFSICDGCVYEEEDVLVVFHELEPQSVVATELITFVNTSHIAIIGSM